MGAITMKALYISLLKKINKMFVSALLLLFIIKIYRCAKMEGHRMNKLLTYEMVIGNMNKLSITFDEMLILNLQTHINLIARNSDVKKHFLNTSNS